MHPMKYEISADIEALCDKCGQTWHVIVALTGNKIAKAECKQCGGRHRYRPIEGAEADPAKPKPKTRRKSTSSRKAAVPLIEAEPSRPVRAYNAKEEFAVADAIDHPSFGRGVVQEIAGPGKIRVSFADQPRVLVHRRA